MLIITSTVKLLNLSIGGQNPNSSWVTRFNPNPTQTSVRFSETHPYNLRRHKFYNKLDQDACIREWRHTHRAYAQIDIFVQTIANPHSATAVLAWTSSIRETNYRQLGDNGRFAKMIDSFLPKIIVPIKCYYHSYIEAPQYHQ